MKTSLKKIAVALGSVAILAVATNASAFPLFGVQPGALNPLKTIPGGVTGLDTIKGGASERLIASGDTFSGNGLLTLDGFYAGATELYSPKFSSGIPIYITFSLTDKNNPGPPIGTPGSTQTLTSLNFKIFADINGNDTFTPATTAADPGVTNTADDVLLGFGSLLSGMGVVNSGGGSTGGALNSSESLALCSGVGKATIGGALDTKAADASSVAGCKGAQGTGFFFMPSPFYSIVFDEFNNTMSTFDGHTLVLTGGSGSINFAIPEPDSVALFGIAAVAAGLVARRRRKS